jgi:hypothetical protein
VETKKIVQTFRLYSYHFLTSTIARFHRPVHTIIIPSLTIDCIFGQLKINKLHMPDEFQSDYLPFDYLIDTVAIEFETIMNVKIE